MPAPQRGEDLAILRVGDWRCLVPARSIDRVLAAVAPIAVPGADAPGRLYVRVGGELLPLVFGSALLGADSAALRPSQKMVLLEADGRRWVLCVDAVEDLIPFAPLDGAAHPLELAGGWTCALSGGERTLPVLDLDRLARSACDTPRARARPHASGAAAHDTHLVGR
jgi:chemotaxis signal transduction protein